MNRMRGMKKRRAWGWATVAVLSWIVAVPLAAAAADPEDALVHYSFGNVGIQPTGIVNVTEQELMDYYAGKAAEAFTNELMSFNDRVNYVRDYLDILLDFDTAQAKRHMPMIYSVFEGVSTNLLSLSGNWQWSSNGVHATSDGQPHTASGMSRYIVPHFAVLEQAVKLDPAHPPTEISVGFTVPLHGYAGWHDTFCRARWGGTPVTVQTDNTPYDFYVGPLPPAGQWVTLRVPALDIGLGGGRRRFSTVQFREQGGDAQWGPTVFRRNEIELFPDKALGIFHWGESPALQARVNNYTTNLQWYLLNYDLYDFDGTRIGSTNQILTVTAETNKTIVFEVPAEYYTDNPTNEPLRSYFTVDVRLDRAGETNAARTTFGLIKANRTGKTTASPFGTLLWDVPSTREGFELYQDAGVKLVSMVHWQGQWLVDGEGPQYTLFTDRDMLCDPHIWSLAYRTTKLATNAPPPTTYNPCIPEVSNLAAEVAPKGGPFISNWWQPDLGLWPSTFGGTCPYFFHAARQGNPNAIVGTGAMAVPNIHFTDVMMQYGGAGNLDYVQFMGYYSPHPPERGGMFEEMAAIRRIFSSYGVPNTQIWIAEFNYFNHLDLERPELSAHWIHSGVSRDLAGAYLIREHLAYLAAGASKMLPNAVFQTSRAPLRQSYGHTMTGCYSHRHDNTPQPLYFAYSVMARNVEGKTCAGLLPGAPQGVYAARFDAATNTYESLGSAPRVIAYWSDHGIRPVSLSVGQPEVKVHDYVGNVRPFRTLDGIVTVSAGPRPAYLLLDSVTNDVTFTGSPLFSAAAPHYDVTYNESNTVFATFMVTNPTASSLDLTLAFAAPTWCASAPEQIPVTLATNAATNVTFRVSVPEYNRDRIYHEMAELVPRAEHTISVDLLDGGGDAVGRASVPLIVHEPLEVRMRPQLDRIYNREEPKLLVRLRNRSGEPQTGTVEMRTEADLTITPATSAFSVAANDETVLTFDVAGEPGVVIGDYASSSGYFWTFGIGEGYVIEAVAQSDQGWENRQSRGFSFFPCLLARIPPRVDGNDGDWEGAAWVEVEPEGRNNALPYFSSSHSDGQETYEMYFGGHADLSARWSCMWDVENFYFFFQVNDDIFHQPYTNSLIWNGDSIRLAIDRNPDDTDAGIQPVPRDPADVLQFNIGLTPLGPQVYRRYPSAGLPAGLVTAAQAAVDNSAATVTVYEVAIPWSEIGTAPPESGGWTQLSILFDDSDGHGRETWINWFGGLHSVAREPRLMGDVLFTEGTGGQLFLIR